MPRCYGEFFSQMHLILFSEVNFQLYFLKREVFSRFWRALFDVQGSPDTFEWKVLEHLK